MIKLPCLSNELTLSALTHFIKTELLKEIDVNIVRYAEMTYIFYDCDVNGNRKIGIEDVLYIYQIMAKSRASLSSYYIL